MLQLTFYHCTTRSSKMRAQEFKIHKKKRVYTMNNEISHCQTVFLY